ncbi:Spo0B domain-containing protein [Virgibacillus senegalensis]|uniref:Spo0B domain-containing protein n=1 Tax=Virgibacillus senegalensis TaxID=1499679 RepID=UPI00069E6499|nr:Spo0B domain-containing protein [Virgibacillus senegalensis]
MEPEKVVELLSHYRHDWMNTMQLIGGYASMGKLEKVKEKVNQVSAEMEKERRIASAGLPQTALWVISFNWHHINFRLDYDISLDSQGYSIYDEEIVSRLNSLVKVIGRYTNNMEMYDGKFTLHSDETDQLVVFLEFSGVFDEPGKMYEELSELDERFIVSMSEAEKNKCTVKWVCS